MWGVKNMLQMHLKSRDSRCQRYILIHSSFAYCCITKKTPKQSRDIKELLQLTGAILLRHSATAARLSLSFGRLSLIEALLTGLAAQRAL
jgi:hypothetical protein